MGKRGFTLAEVLITLAIIGVVAALTIPTVVKNYQKQETVTKLKKVYSVLNQAFNNSQAENGMYQTWDIGQHQGSEEYFNRYWKPYLKVEKICRTPQECGFKSASPYVTASGDHSSFNVVNLNYRTTFLTTDGTLIVLVIATTSAEDEVLLRSEIYVDLNNSKGPNKFGRDLFVFARSNQGVLPYGYKASAENIDSGCSKSGNGNYCAAKIAREGWQMKDDYPW